MGFLDHSTNNVIVDAVLTDEGRRLLATQGTLTPTKFSLADDEVDYTLLTKFGRQVGKEKIIKNTPIFEATTNGFLGLKYRLATANIADATVSRMPITEFIEGVSNNTVTFIAGTTMQLTVRIEQKMSDANLAIPADFRDQMYTVVLPNKFVQLRNEVPENIDPATGQAFYSKISTQNTTTFNLGLRRIPTAAEFSEFGSETNKNIIRGTGSIIGESSGFVLQFAIRILKDSTVSV